MVVHKNITSNTDQKFTFGRRVAAVVAFHRQGTAAKKAEGRGEARKKSKRPRTRKTLTLCKSRVLFSKGGTS